MTIREQLARNLAYYRKKAGFTQKEAAKRLGTKLTTISSWERSVSQPSADMLVAIAMLYKVPLSALKELLATDFESLYGTFSAEEKRYFWRSIIKEIRFDKNRNYEIIFLT